MPESDVQPLNDDEMAVWLALTRVSMALPRIVDAELMRDTGLTLTEYQVLMVLSESRRRMSDLAEAVQLSVSGLTRLVERLEREGMVERVRSDGDRRGQTAVLTDPGRERLEAAWPAHLASIRRMVIANVRGFDLPALAKALNTMIDENVAVTRTPGPRKTRWS